MLQNQPVKEKKSTSSSKAAEALARKEEERNAKIASLQQEIDELESAANNCEDISLIGVQVSSDKFGTGMMVSQDINKIGVQFEEFLVLCAGQKVFFTTVL